MANQNGQMDMKDKYIIRGEEQLGLITDPFVLSIINLIEKDSATIEWVAKEMDEKISLVADYMDRMHRAGLLTLVEEEGETRYQKVAASFQMETDAPRGKDIHHHWVFGLLHHLESNLLDLLKVTADFEDYHQELDKLGYGKTMTMLTKVYLTKEEFMEFRDYIVNFFKKYEDKPEGELGDKRPYEIVLDASPELSCLRKLIKDKK